MANAALLTTRSNLVVAIARSCYVHGAHEKPKTTYEMTDITDSTNTKKITQERTRAGPLGQRVHIGHLLKIFVASDSPRSGGAPSKSETPLEMTDFED